MTPLAKQFEPSKNRLINNAYQMMMTANDPGIKKYWQKVYLYLCKQYNKLQ